MRLAREKLIESATELAAAEDGGSSRFGRRPPSLGFDWFHSDDGLRLRYATVRAPESEPRGTMLVLPGRSEYIEKYFETVADLIERRLDVVVLDWRGQGRSGRLLPERRRGHIASYQDYLRDLEDFFDRVLRSWARPPLYLVAHSMGAHLALRFLHERPDAVAGAILNAPMVDLRARVLPRALLSPILRGALRLGLHRSYVPGYGDRGAVHGRFETNRLTSCPRRFAAMRSLLERTEGVALGGPTFQWLMATLESITIVERPGFAEAIHTPILVVGAGADRVVCNVAQARFAERLPNGRRVELSGARHEILMETDAVRTAYFEELQAFLDELVAERS